MAKALAFSPQSQNLKNQILGIQIIRERELSISSSWSWTRIFSPNSGNNPHFRNLYCGNINRNSKNVLHVGGLTSFSATPLPALLNSHNSVRSRCRGLRLPSPSLLPLRRSRSSHLWVSVMSSQSYSDGPNPTPQDSIKTVRCVIKGRVQGVFYRNWTIDNANQLDLKGWVRNRRDGSVEALFSGKAEVVDEMLQRCRRGPPDAMVTALEAIPCNEDPGVHFDRRPTV